LEEWYETVNDVNAYADTFPVHKTSTFARKVKKNTSNPIEVLSGEQEAEDLQDQEVEVPQSSEKAMISFL